MFAKIFKPMIKLITDPRFAIPVAAILCLALVAILTRFAFGSWMVATSVTLALALIVLIVVLIRTLRSTEREQRLAGGLEDPGFGAAARGSETDAGDSRGVRSVFMEALQDIRRSRLGPAGIEALPWWIALGSSDSGKSPFIRSCGLDVPAEFAHQLRSEPTHGCRFVLSNQGVLIDTAGRFIDETEESPEEWKTLIRLLKRHRPAGPLEGVLVTISAASLLSEDPARITESARTIRRRLNELSEGLGFDVPIYIVVTELDAVRGFGELIVALPVDRRHEAFGWTNDRRDLADVAGRAGEALRGIANEIDEILPELLIREPDSARRRNLFLFPQELRILSARVVDVLRHAFAPSVYDEVPFLRGVYFASATRGPKTLSSVARQLGQSWAVVADPARTTDESFFASGLFRDILIGDEELAVETSRVGGRARNVVSGLAAAASITILALATFSAFGNFNAIDDLKKKSDRLLDAPSSLDDADSLRESIELARSKDAAFAFPLIGRTREHAAERAIRVFTSTLGAQHVRPAKQRLTGVLRRADHDAFEALAALAMDVPWMAKRGEGDPDYRPNLVQYTTLDASQRNGEVFARAYDAYVRWIPDKELQEQIQSEGHSVLESATNLLDLRRLEDWSERRAPQSPPVRYRDFGLDTADGGQRIEVYGVYTRSGWEGLVRDLLKAVEDSGGTADSNIRRFRTGYVNRFDRSWRDFLLGTPLAVEASTAVFESPHLALFERIANEVGTDLPREGGRPEWMTLALELRREDASPTDVGEASAASPAAWLRYKEALDQVSVDVGKLTIQTGDSPLQLAMKMGDSSSFTEALALLEELVPPRSDTAESKQIRRLLSMPILDAAQAVLQAAMPELNRRWYDSIYRPYEMDGRDIVSLYGPNGGALSKFIDEELGAFFDRNEPRRMIGGLRLPMSSTFLGWIDEARTLQQALFPGAGASLAIPVRMDGIPSKVVGSANTYVTRRELSLDCGGSTQRWEYREGMDSETLLWKPDCNQVSLRIWVSTPGEPARELLPRKEWSSPLAFPDFLREAKPLQGSEFQWNLEYEDAVVQIKYAIRTGLELLKLEHRPLPKSLGGND